MLIILATVFILASLGFYLFTTVLCHIATWRKVRRRRGTPSAKTVPPAISIIKPIRGIDQAAEENFLSFMRCDYPAPYELILAVEERDDPVVPLIQKLLADTQLQSHTRLIFSRRQDKREIGKTINLMAGVQESVYDILVLSDSDVRNSEGFLEELVRPLEDPQVGMVYACPAYRGAGDWAAALMALTVNEAILALSAAPPSSAIGSTMAIRKDVLKAVGGLSPMRHRIGIDAALGRAVHARGYRIEMITQPVTLIHHQGDFGSWWRQMHRWLVTIRRYIGARYLLIPVSGIPVPWATLYLLIALNESNPARGFALWGGVIFFRLLSFSIVNLYFVKETILWRYVWLLVPLEFLKMALWLGAYLNPRVVWRGIRYRVMADATVRPEP